MTSVHYLAALEERTQRNRFEYEMSGAKELQQVKDEEGAVDASGFQPLATVDEEAKETKEEDAVIGGDGMAVDVEADEEDEAATDERLCKEADRIKSEIEKEEREKDYLSMRTQVEEMTQVLKDRTLAEQAALTDCIGNKKLNRARNYNGCLS
jgi:hypothetical protein